MSVMQLLWESYWKIPTVTRVVSTLTVILAIATELEVVSKFSLYFTPELTFGRLQLWRLVTSFFCIEQVDIIFFFDVLFLYRYCFTLESVDFENRPEDFVLMIGFGMSLLLVLSYVVGEVWLHNPFNAFLLYVWSRRNPIIQVEFFGFIFPAAFAPLCLLVFGLLFAHVNRLVAYFIGFLTGHAYFHAYFIFPTLPTGFHILRSPQFMKRWFRYEASLAPVTEVSPIVLEGETSTQHEVLEADVSTLVYHDATSSVMSPVFDVDPLDLENQGRQAEGIQRTESDTE